MELGIHFQKHGHKFGSITKADYERLAEEFMFGPMNADTKECTRPQRGKCCRLDFTTRYFGVKYPAPPIVLTFYPPSGSVIARHGGLKDFFNFECGRNS
jgi:hypothetical protein